MIALAVSVVVLGSCGSEQASAPSAPTTVVDTAVPRSAAGTAATAVVLDPFRSAGGSEAQAVLVLEAGCAALSPIDRSYDSYSLNGDIYGLFSGWGATFQGDGVARDPDEFDVALVDACDTHRSDPNAFVAQMSAELDLSAADIDRAIDDACARFAAWERGNRDDPYAPESFDLVPPAVVAVLGDALSPARVVDAYCDPATRDLDVGD